MWNTIPRPSTQKEIKIKLLDLINDLFQLKIKLRAYIISTLYGTIILTFTSPMVIQFNGGNLKFEISNSKISNNYRRTNVETLYWFSNQAYGIDIVEWEGQSSTAANINPHIITNIIINVNCSC